MGCVFDKEVTEFVGGEQLKYGIIFGSEKIVFIKVGADQNIRKCQDGFQIYIRAANRTHKYDGATVIVASNPDVPHEDIDEKIIRWAASSQGYDEFKLCLWGMSDGAYKNLSLAKHFPETVKFIGLNTSFISLEDFEEKLQALPRVKKFLIYGTEDDEIDTVFPALRDQQNDYLKTMFVVGADHRFDGLPLPIICSVDLVEDHNDEKEVIQYGHYWDGTGMENVPIEWVVLEKTDDYFFLVSKQAITSKQFHEDDCVTWEGSNIRMWLNNEFLNSAFDEHERAHIAKTINTTYYHAYFETKESTEYTEDKLFLLDWETFTHHFPTMESRIPEQSKLAIDTQIKCKFSNDLWLRDGGDIHNARIIEGNGFSEGYGSNRCIAGIRPAMYIRRENFMNLPLEGQLGLFDES